jgi:hypothetical protein
MKVDAVIGLVTNSSTEIYTTKFVDFDKTVMQSGQELLDAFGMNAKAEDIFEIQDEALVVKDTGKSIHFRKFFHELYDQYAEYEG